MFLTSRKMHRHVVSVGRCRRWLTVVLIACFSHSLVHGPVDGRFHSTSVLPHCAQEMFR